MSRTTTIALLIAFCICGTLTTLAFYWDEAWHTDKGRDSFWIPAHQMLYGSVAGLIVIVAIWSAILSWNQVDWRDIVRHWPLTLAFTGAAVTLMDAPIDGIWHNTFGRDAVFWSPPHVLAVAGLTMTAAGMLLKASGLGGRAGNILTVMTAALVMSASVVLVMEYDSDVPQFSTLWYLPVIALTATFTLTLAGSVSPLRWIGTLTSLTYAGIMTAVFVFLSAVLDSTPIIPPLVIPGLVYDLARRYNLPLPVRSTLYSVALYATYTPYLNRMLNGVSLSTSDVLIGLPLAAVISTLVLYAFGAGSSRPALTLSPSSAAVAAGLLLALLPALAFAHDPGQGPKVGNSELTATQTDGQLSVTGQIVDPDPCDVFTARGLVARRAREEVRGTLQQTAACTFTGQLSLPDRGRWFVYLELDQSGKGVEVWLPVMSRDGTRTFEKESWIYVPPTRKVNAISISAGIIIYALSVALITAVGIGFRRTRARREAGIIDPADIPPSTVTQGRPAAA
jgi:hypothetical protein